MRTPKLILTLALALLTVGAAQAATVYVAHGINGIDLGTAENLPVDVVVNGDCFLPGFTFGTIAGPVELPAGSYDIEVKLSDGACGGDTAIAGTVDLRSSEKATLVAHLTSEGAPTLSKFRDPVRRVRDGFGRFEVRHTAFAPTVDVEFKRKKGEVAFADLTNGTGQSADLNRGRWTTRIFAATTKSLVTDPVKLRPRPGSVTIVYAVGNLDNGTFGFLVQTIAAHTDGQ